MSRPGRKAVLCCAVTLAAGASSALAAQPLIRSWNGSSPYQCTVQYAGLNALAPDGAADPYCIEFDKTRQSVLPSFGLVEFLKREPLRFSTAFGKCFYYQRDHWRGAIVQNRPSTQLWNWDGQYFIDRSTGEAGLHMTNLYAGPPGRMKPITWSLRIKAPWLFPVIPGCATRARTEASTIYVQPR
ncbi:MAG: hypothetical protein JHC95_11125 [Solirubrobacteraceae bacterium]|nr:hypothetical protein [Solirubrobacteraceae bacterium]